MKKVLSLILVILMLCSSFVSQYFSSYAELSESGKYDDSISYTFNSATGEVIITGNGNMTDYFGYDSPFLNQTNIKSVVINDGITSIGFAAFAGCRNLTNVFIPNSVTSIGGSAFNNCSGLTSVDIPNSVTSIGGYAFYGCSGLTSVVIPDSVTDIGISAFSACNGITDLTVPSSIDVLKRFEGCKNIKKVILLKGSGTMQNYSGFSDISSDDITQHPDYYYTPWYNSRNILKELVLEDGITNIGSSAFYGCSGLTSVTIPDSVSSIGSSAFCGCSSLTSITIPSSVVIIGSNAFGYTGYYNNKINWENGLLYVNNALIGAETNSIGDTITLDSKTKCVGGSVFKNCNQLKTVILPDGLKGISDSAFRECDELLSINIPDSVLTIGGAAFYGCSSLKSINIPYTITNICDFTFYDCSSLISINIPDSVISIGDNSFGSCSNLTTVDIGNGVTSIGSSVFSNCTNLKTAYFGTGIETIDKSAFKTLITIGIPADKRIDFSCFNDCTGLQVINLTPGETGTMVDWSSDYADSLWYLHKDTIREVNLEEGIKNISDSAFNGCSNLIKTNVPSTVTSIGRYAYAGCFNLRNITITSPNCTIPANEITIDPYATIYGYNNSTAKAYADKYDRAFVSIGDYTCEEHSVVTDAAVAPTCTATGLSEGSHCSVCGAVLVEQQVVPALGHDFETRVIVPATCSSTGTSQYTCTRCGFSQTAESAKLSHNYVQKVTEPTCISKGFTVYTCSACGDTFRADYVPAIDTHDYKAVVTRPATCAQTGIKTYTCTVCGDKYNETIPMTEHTIITDEAVAPTCTKFGLTEGKYCSVCGKVFELQEKLEPLGHDFGAEIAPATLSENGVITHPCSRCNKAAESEVIPMPKTFALAVTSYVYTGKSITPAVAVKDAKGKLLVKGTDYTVAYSTNIAVGTAKAVITFTGNYSGSKTLTFTILPKGTILALAAAKNAFTAKWTKIAGVTGYQIQYSTNAKFTGAKTVTVKGAAKYAQAVKNLKGGTKYFVRIRTYQTVGGKNYISAWSAAKAVITKK